MKFNATWTGSRKPETTQYPNERLSRLLARRVDGIFLSDFEQGEIGPDLYRHACLMGLEGLVSKRRESTLPGRPITELDQGEEPQAPGDVQGDGSVLLKREQKTTLGEMRSSAPRRLLVYCADYKCTHHVEIDADQWGDDVRLSDLEPLFVCRACGHRGADIRPLFEPHGWERTGSKKKRPQRP